MYSNIMIPVSFDEDRDIASAIEIAKILSSAGARVTFAHALEAMPAYVTDFIPAETFDMRRDAAKKLLARAMEGIPNGHGVILDGSAGRSLVSWADENEADCIVVASHRPAISDIVMGSTAAWIVRHANCAVHVIR